MRLIAEISAQALLVDRDQDLQRQECQQLRKALKHATTELDEAVKLAGVLYETNEQMGVVIDHLLKERASDGRQSESFEAILSRILRQREKWGERNRPEGAVNDGVGRRNANADG